MPSKEVKEFRRLALRQGWSITQGKGSHEKWLSPVTGNTVIVGSDPSWRNVRNLKCELKREGLQL